MDIRLTQKTTLESVLEALREPPYSYIIEDDQDGALLFAQQLLRSRSRALLLDRQVVVQWFAHPLDQGEVAIIYCATTEDQENPQIKDLAFRVVDILTIESLETWLKGREASEIVGVVGSLLNEDDVVNSYLRSVSKRSPVTLEGVPRARWLIAYRWLVRCLTSSGVRKEIRRDTALAVLELLFKLQQNHRTLPDAGKASQ